nr:hypothetical protein [Tanacetum cinerariifolium]
MDMTIDQQVALNEALIPHAGRLRIGKSKFRLRSDLKSKESTLQVVYDVLKLTPFYKAFLVTTDQFDELPFEEDILAFLRELGHIGEIKMITDSSLVSSSNPLGMYHKKNVDFAYLLWEDFVYQVEYKDAKKSNEMYYPRFTKVIVNFFMTKDPSIPRRNKVNWHYARDDHMFTAIKLVSRHQNTQQYGVILPVKLTNEDIRNFESYKEYYGIASGAEPPKTKASVRKKQSSSDTTVPPPTKGKRLKTSAKLDKPTKEKQPTKSSTGKGLTVLSEKSSDEDDENDDDEEKISKHDDDDDDDQSYDDDQEDQDNDDQDELKTLETNFLEFMQTNQFVEAVSSILGIVDKYIDYWMNAFAKVVVRLQLDMLRDEAQAENEDLLNKLDENILKIIKEKVKEHVKNIYKALVDAYECDKLILDTYRDTVTLKDIEMMRTNTKNPSLDQTGGPREDKKEKNQSQPVHQRKRHPRHLASQLKGPNLNTRLLTSLHQQRTQCTLLKIWKNPHLRSLRQVQLMINMPWISNLAKKADSCTFFNELMDTPVDFLAFVINQLKVDTLTPKLLASPTYELMKGSCKSLVELEFILEEVYKATTDQLDWNNLEGQQYPNDLLKPLPLIANSQGRRVIPFDHFINNDLKYLRGGASSQKYTTSVTKTKAAYYGHIKWIEDLVPRTIIIAVTELQIVAWHTYKHLDWINVRRDDDKLYKFKEGDFKRLRIQDIEDMLLLLVQGKLTNLTVDERFAFNVSLRMFTKSIVIQRRVEDLQLGVKSYQKKLNLTKPDTDGTLNDVRTTLDDRLKGIQMKYLPQTIWRRSEKHRAAAMIQAIDKQLKTKSFMRSLEKFVGGRLYEGDFRLLQRTI